MKIQLYAKRACALIFLSCCSCAGPVKQKVILYNPYSTKIVHRPVGHPAVVRVTKGLSKIKPAMSIALPQLIEVEIVSGKLAGLPAGERLQIKALQSSTDKFLISGQTLVVYENEKGEIELIKVIELHTPTKAEAIPEE